MWEACFKIWIESERCKHVLSSSVLCRHIHKVHRYICAQNTYQFVRYDTSMQMICHSVSLSLCLSLSPSYIMGNRETIIFRHNQGKLPGKEKKMVLENEIGFVALILSHCEPLPSTTTWTDPSLTTQYVAFDYDCQLKITEHSCILFYHS